MSGVRIGLLVFCTEDSAPVQDLAREAEDRGFHALWVPEHTHIPAARPTIAPGGVPLPDYYAHLPDPLITLTAAAMVTTRLRLGTGVCLAAQHDPIVLAKQIATLDRISGGRLSLGIGAGWNEDEMLTHGISPADRWAHLVEHIEAMKAIWADDVASYHGKYVEFDQIWSWPKPVQRPHPPLLLGTFAKAARQRVPAMADGWLPMPIFAGRGLGDEIDALRADFAAAGRDPDRLDVSVFCVEPTKPERMLKYWEYGITSVIVQAPIGPLSVFREFLDLYQPLLSDHQEES